MSRREREIAAGPELPPALLRGILDSALDAVIALDADGRIVLFNAAAGALFGRAATSVLGKPLLVLVAEGHRTACAAQLQALCEGQAASGGRRQYLLAQHANGGTFPVEMSFARVPAGSTPLLSVIVRNLADRDPEEQRLLQLGLRYLDSHDAATGLANRSLLLERMEPALREADRQAGTLALVTLDLPEFAVDRQLGQDGADALLGDVARRLRRLVPDPDLLARLGPGRFACVLAGVGDPAELAHRTSQILDELQALPFFVGERSLEVSARAGIALFPVDGADAPSLLHSAERAQRSGGAAGRVSFCQPEMNVRVAEELAVEARLRAALENNEFVLHYQPKVDSGSRRLAGFEALIRWNDPVRGQVPPSEFIPLLEETGLIVQVSRWAVRRALSDHADWSRQGLHPPRIAVNVSAIELRRPDFIEALRENLRGTLADALDLEITESILMDNVGEIIPKLLALRSMGIHVAIDDFGTGYSSLSYLGRLPLSTVKIDLSFIRDMTTDPDSMTIVSTIISLAHSLGLRVVAEGVEQEEQARYLTLLRCDELQGYLFGRPASAAQTALLLSQSADPDALSIAQAG